MSKIRILHFPMGGGGIARYAVGNWIEMDKDKFSCDFATLKKKLGYEDLIYKSNAGLHYISCYAEEDLEKFCGEMRKLLKGNYDIVHLHTSYWKSFAVEEVAKSVGIPKIIVHSHNTGVDIEDETKRTELERNHNILKSKFNLDLATDFWACSKKAGEWLYGDQIPKNRVKIMNNAIDVDKFVYNENIRNYYRNKLGLEDSFVIGHVGRFKYQKNHDFLIDAFLKVLKKNNKAKLMLLGDGVLRKDIEDKVKKYDIEDKVIFMGNVDNVNEMMQVMDVFCLPSRFEGLPIVLIEAQAAGLKCLISDAVTNEVRVTDNIKRIDLNIDEWIDELVELGNGYIREDMYSKITDKGYNIKNQIKKLERAYLDI